MEFVNHYERKGGDLNRLLWRYMSFDKFVDLILSQHLYLRRTDLFEDPYEGAVSSFYEGDVKERYSGMADIIPELEDLANEMTYQLIGEQKKVRILTHSSCWHLNDYESAAMWSLYSETKNSIAIKTTVGRLFDAISTQNKNSKIQGNVHFSVVDYIDYADEQDFPKETRSNWIKPMFLKRKSFIHENEFRVLLADYRILTLLNYAGRGGQKRSLDDWKKMIPSGINLEVNIHKLIQEIYISPTASEAFFNLVKNLLSKLNFDNLVCKQSDLYTLK